MFTTGQKNTLNMNHRDVYVSLLDLLGTRSQSHSQQSLSLSSHAMHNDRSVEQEILPVALVRSFQLDRVAQEY